MDDQLTEGTRFTILVNAEINRLRYGRPAEFVHRVAAAAEIEPAVLTIWIARPAWKEKIKSATYPAGTPICPNPNCGAPVGHLHSCG